MGCLSHAKLENQTILSLTDVASILTVQVPSYLETGLNGSYSVSSRLEFIHFG